MVGYKSDRVEITEDGVLLKGGSAAENAKLAAEYENDLKSKELKGAEKFDKWLSDLGDWFTVASRSLWPILAVASTVLVMVVAGTAWYNLLPYEGLRLVFSIIGVLVVAGIALMGGKSESALYDKDHSEALVAGVAAILFIALGMVATVSFQVTKLLNNESGRVEISADIKTLERERNSLQIATAVPPLETSEQVTAAIAAYRSRFVVNQPGTQLNESIGSKIGDCSADTWYTRTYCPPLKDMETRLASAKAYETKTARLAEISAEIEAKRNERPPAAGPIEALKELVGANDKLSGYLIPMGIMLLLELFMFYCWFETNKAARKRRAATS